MRFLGNTSKNFKKNPSNPPKPGQKFASGRGIADLGDLEKTQITLETLFILRLADFRFMSWNEQQSVHFWDHLGGGERVVVVCFVSISCSFVLIFFLSIFVNQSFW